MKRRFDESSKSDEPSTSKTKQQKLDEKSKLKRSVIEIKNLNDNLEKYVKKYFILKKLILN